MQRPDWAPDTIDIERPSAARMYDYHLGGSHNFMAGRAAARAIDDAVPEAPLAAAQTTRAFLRRAMRFRAESGVRQFRDLGSGIPTVVRVPQWRPESPEQAEDAARAASIGGVGRLGG